MSIQQNTKVISYWKLILIFGLIWGIGGFLVSDILSVIGDGEGIDLNRLNTKNLPIKLAIWIALGMIIGYVLYQRKART